MVIISKAILKDYSKEHPDVEVALQKWYEETKVAKWKNFNELKVLLIRLILSEMIDMYLI